MLPKAHLAMPAHVFLEHALLLVPQLLQLFVVGLLLLLALLGRSSLGFQRLGGAA